MQKETRIRFTTLTLGFFLLFLYIAAKIHFFRRFSYSETGTFLREHSIYWLAVAVVAFLIWLVEKTVEQLFVTLITFPLMGCR